MQVIKIGGNVVDNPVLLEQFIADFASVGGPKILVHGGGVMASRMQKKLGQQPTMIEGRRVTDEDTLKIVTMVYAGWCSKSIVAMLQKHGCNSIGLCGADANLIEATRRPPVKVCESKSGDSTARMVDYGFVGDVDPSRINSEFLFGLVNQGITPVVCAITHDRAGNLLNTNADTIASSIAIALAGQHGPGSGKGTSDATGTAHALEYPADVSLVYCFEKDGVLYDKDDDSSLIPEITPESYAALKAEGRISEGMIPKIDNSFRAIRAGVSEVLIKHARNILHPIGTTLTDRKTQSTD